MGSQEGERCELEHVISNVQPCTIFTERAYFPQSKLVEEIARRAALICAQGPHIRKDETHSHKVPHVEGRFGFAIDNGIEQRCEEVQQRLAKWRKRLDLSNRMAEHFS